MIRSIAPILRLMGLQFTRWQLRCCDVLSPIYPELMLRANRLERDSA